MHLATPVPQLCRSTSTHSGMDPLEPTKNDRIKPWAIAAHTSIAGYTTHRSRVNPISACARRSTGAERPRDAKREPAAEPRPNGEYGRRPSGLTNGGHYTLTIRAS